MFKPASADYVVRSVISNIEKYNFFSRGWGNPETLRRLAAWQELVLDKRRFLREVYSVLENTDIKLSKGKKISSSVTSYDGVFTSPVNKFIPKALPPECEQVRFQVILPDKWKDKKPVHVNLAGTGDHSFWRRRFFTTLPLAKEYGIGAINLENPFYGSRKPRDQSGSAVNYVSDIFLMGVALSMETIVLLLWCKRNGLGPLGVTGVSMGGHMASVAATAWFEPLAIVPCLSWTSGAPCFTEGILSYSVNWRVLETQLNEQPEYMTLLRNDSEFKRKLLTHYTNTDYLADLRRQEDTPGLYNQITSSISSYVSTLQPWSYIDSKGRRLGSMIAEADVWKYIESISKQIPDPSAAIRRINIEIFKKGMWKSSSDSFQPSQETLDYMVTIMDQSTHLSHLNKPCAGSSIIYVCGEHDRYFPRECYNLTPKDIWNEAEIRYIDSGHVMGIIQHQQDFRLAIKDSFQMLGCNF